LRWEILQRVVRKTLEKKEALEAKNMKDIEQMTVAEIREALKAKEASEQKWEYLDDSGEWWESHTFAEEAKKNGTWRKLYSRVQIGDEDYGRYIGQVVVDDKWVLFRKAKKY
jgi:hypothetical protein